MINKYTITIGVIVVLFIGYSFLTGTTAIPLGGVTVGNEYNATSTAGSNVYGAFTGDQLLKTGWGSFGSVIITGANTGIVNFYNATTSDVTQRTNNIASSTILLASIPASTVAGTYTFDVIFTDGLLLELETGIMPTTTVTWR